MKSGQEQNKKEERKLTTEKDKNKENNKPEFNYTGEPGSNPKPKFNAYWVYGIILIVFIVVPAFAIIPGTKGNLHERRSYSYACCW